MELKSLSLCSTGLDFKARTAWPEALPAIAWGEQLIAGFEKKSGSAVSIDPDTQPLHLLIKACHPDLGLAELARLISCIEKLAEPFEATNFLKCYGLHDSETLRRTLAHIIALPIAAQNWIDEKTLGPRELSIFLSMPEPLQLNALLEQITARNISRQIGVKILEIGGELLLMNIAWPTWESHAKDPDGRLWLKAAGELRHPNSTATDQSRSQRVTTLPWPAHIHAEWKREGDRAGLSIQFSSQSVADWQKRINDLEAIKPHLSGENSPWT
jgi:hypothetical protein